MKRLRAGALLRRSRQSAKLSSRVTLAERRDDASTESRNDDGGLAAAGLRRSWPAQWFLRSAKR